MAVVQRLSLRNFSTFSLGWQPARARQIKETLRAMYQFENVAQAQALFEKWYKVAMRSKLETVRRVG
jgi:hypothetical protein